MYGPILHLLDCNCISCKENICYYSEAIQPSFIMSTRYNSITQRNSDGRYSKPGVLGELHGYVYMNGMRRSDEWNKEEESEKKRMEQKKKREATNRL